MSSESPQDQPQKEQISNNVGVTTNSTSNEETSRSQDDNVKEVNGNDDTKEEEQEEDAELDDLFGDDNDDDDDDVKKSETEKSDSDSDEDDEGENINHRSRHRESLGLDDDEAEEQAMYTRKFYGEDANNFSDQDETTHTFKEENVELVRHIIPSKANVNETASHNEIFYARIPNFLTIDPIPFDPPSFEAKVNERASNSASREDQLDDRLIDENTVRWRYSRDKDQHVFKESNTQIVQWSDGTYSLKVGEECTDILVNDTSNTFLTVSHDQQELIQCYEGGEIKKTLMFIPTSTNSKIHQKLSKAVIRRNQRQSKGPGTYIVSMDPEVEKKELERKQSQILRDRRRRQLKEKEKQESPDAAFETGFRKQNSPTTYGASRRNEYEEDDFLVDDDEEEEAAFDDEEDDNEEEEEEEDADEENASRLRNLKREGAAMYREEEEEEKDRSETKRRRVAVIEDDEDED
ncbi:Leo1p [Saccharomyces cerevisiae YJM1527]|nr:Leo1p [Saccharomyces cerevisiae YJM1444]AJU12600.1 Leo1p [Saccharomyces cerevisiae YJM1527]CAI4784141.1 CCC_1a_G0049920.mRNA.1.CDS.1 [Saccharomyces cerevisiae]CAI7460628.1 CCC_1a_G0049920.mRNA.1.CDS.1 [Saccharomyces cerevisiae]